MRRVLFLALLVLVPVSLAQGVPASINPDWGSARDAIGAGVVPILGIMAVFLIIAIAAGAVAVISRAVSPRSDED